MIKRLFFLFAVVFFLTGALVIAMDTWPTSPIGRVALDLKSTIFGIHMFCWMTAGMISNYLWDLFKASKEIEDIHIPDLMLPLLVSPIVFFGIWSMWPDQKIAFALNLVAFQNGFFWQVVLSKAGPVAQPHNQTNVAKGP